MSTNPVNNFRPAPSSFATSQPASAKANEAGFTPEGARKWDLAAPGRGAEARPTSDMTARLLHGALPHTFGEPAPSVIPTLIDAYDKVQALL